MKLSDRPKQYLEIKGRPVISYCLTTFQQHSQVDGIVIVADTAWQDYIMEWIAKKKITKFLTFALPGDSRQESIFHGLLACREFLEAEDAVIIHDAARPFVSEEIISGCVKGAAEHDGAMPVITIKDTVYQSRDGKSIHSLLDRNELFAGQAPESFRFGKYLEIHQHATPEEISLTKGSSEIAYHNGMDIFLFPGEEKNFKITTMEDLTNFESEIEKME